MNVSFAHPFIAGFALLALLPLAIHLFNRRRARPKPFAALDFLMRSERRTARALRLRRVALFCARTALLLALPLALARPQLVRGDAGGKARGPAATVLALDTSLSMRARVGGEARIERARRLAREAILDLPEGDAVTFLDCAQKSPPPAAPGFDRAEVLRQLARADATFEAQDLTACLSRAARALEGSPLPDKRLLLATDLTQAGFRFDLPAPMVTLPGGGEVRPELVLLDAVGEDAPQPNLTLAELLIEPALSIGHRAYHFQITVENHAPQAVRDLPILLHIGDKVVAKGFLDVPARGSAVKILSHRFEQSGPTAGTVELSVGGQADALSEDDRHHFTLDVPRDVRALVVNGSPNPLRFLDEAFFIQTALTAPGSPVVPTLLDASALAEGAWSGSDLVLLLNVRDLPAGLAEALVAFVEEGGGLFMSLGDQIDPERFNARFSAILPRPLRLMKTAVAPDAEDRERRSAHLAQLGFGHPALDVFAGRQGEGLFSANFFRYFLLEPEPGAGPSSTTLASFDDGAPALIERRLGRGHVVLFTSTVDRDWTDWPIRTSFLPMMQRLMGWLSKTLDPSRPTALRVGGVQRFSTEGDLLAQAVTPPEGAPLAVEHRGDAAIFSETARPGVYRVQGLRAGAAGRLEELDFAVNVAPNEGDLARLDASELKAWFGEKSVTTQGEGAGREDGRRPLWSLLLAGALLCLAVESLLNRR